MGGREYAYGEMRSRETLHSRVAWDGRSLPAPLEFGLSTVELTDELKIFLIEAYESLDSVEQHLIELERRPDELEVVNAIFRAVHSMKGNAGFLGLGSLEAICHRAEALLDRARKGKPLAEVHTSGLLRGVDQIRHLLQHVESTGSDSGRDVHDTIALLNSLLE